MSNKKKDLSDGSNQNWQRQPKNQKLWYYFYAWWFFNCLRNIERQMKELHALYEDMKNLQIKEEKQLQSVTKSLDLRETWRKHRKTQRKKVVNKKGWRFGAILSWKLSPCLLLHDVKETLVLWLSLLHKSVQQSLNLGSAQVQVLCIACQGFTVVRISDNGFGWK